MAIVVLSLSLLLVAVLLLCTPSLLGFPVQGRADFAGGDYCLKGVPGGEQNHVGLVNSKPVVEV